MQISGKSFNLKSLVFYTIKCKTPDCNTTTIVHSTTTRTTTTSTTTTTTTTKSKTTKLTTKSFKRVERNLITSKDIQKTGSGNPCEESRSFTERTPSYLAECYKDPTTREYRYKIINSPGQALSISKWKCFYRCTRFYY